MPEPLQRSPHRFSGAVRPDLRGPKWDTDTSWGERVAYVLDQQAAARTRLP
ncbi:hypothetical protein [Streptomyces sp. NPDC006012]|uniref:hypothetical protein n=1 Tax=Streptomyces sp. NPDC006012 TaxID=3364739 RepID=UPI003683526C